MKTIEKIRIFDIDEKTIGITGKVEDIIKDVKELCGCEIFENVKPQLIIKKKHIKIFDEKLNSFFESKAQINCFNVENEKYVFERFVNGDNQNMILIYQPENARQHSELIGFLKKQVDNDEIIFGVLVNEETTPVLIEFLEQF